MATKKPTSKPSSRGLAGGELSVDPSENVKALAEASARRQDDLRHETNLRIEAELNCVKEIAELRAKHSEKLDTIREGFQELLRKAESERLDSIRQVDREDVNKTAAQALSAIATLATATTTTAETLRGQVATTAQAAATSLANSMGEVNKRLSALELSSSEGRGKQAVESPQFAELIAEQKRLTQVMTSSTGQSTGAKNLWAIMAAVAVVMFGLVTTAIAVITFVLARR